MANGATLKARIQKFGSSLSNMVMPNIGAFIAWGIITAVFMETGWFPNENLAKLIDPILTYLLPLLIGYTGGSVVHGKRGAVTAGIATMGVIVGSEVPMFIGAMIIGPLSGWIVKKFDETIGSKVKTGFEMLVNNFSIGIIGLVLAVLGFYIVGPFVSLFTNLMAQGVSYIIQWKVLPLANIIIEPAKILFLNNAINHGILTPLGAEQASELGKSILFLLEANPGPGLGVLLAFMLYGKGSAKSSASGALIIHFFGGIHEIYFPYVVMKPLLFLAVIAGGVAGVTTLELLGGGLQAAASPGSVIAILALTPRGSYLANTLGITIATGVSFVLSSIILKFDKNEEDSFDESVEKVRQSKLQKVPAPESIQTNNVNRSIDELEGIVFACDAGMGSSAMGASIMRNKVKDAGLDIPVTNSSISELKDNPNVLVITQKELHERAKQKTPNSVFVQVDNFMDSATYDEVVNTLKGVTPDDTDVNQVEESSRQLSDVRTVTIAYAENEKGSATISSSLMKDWFKDKKLNVTVNKKRIAELTADDELVIANNINASDIEGKISSSKFIGLENVVDADEYQKILDRL